MARIAGGCHCGAVRFEAEGEFGQAVSCNCSICRKRGALLAFVPASDFRQTAGVDAMTDYMFNRHVIHHLFCRTCGILSFARGKTPDGSDMVAVNLRCADDIDLNTLKIVDFDGASL